MHLIKMDKIMIQLTEQQKDALERRFNDEWNNK